jgi:hypothetical protein
VLVGLLGQGRVLMSKTPYDPYTMVIKEIPELVDELNKLIMPKLPGGRERQTVWGVLCEASRLYSFNHSIITDEEEKATSDSFLWKAHGEHYAAAMLIRKIADGLGVDNFKLREVPLEPTVPGQEQGGHPDPSGQDQPG